MYTLSYTQEYFLCALNNKGRFSGLTESPRICLFIGGLIELLGEGYLAIEAPKKRKATSKVSVAKPWDNRIPYLQPVYEACARSKKPKNVSDIVLGSSTKQQSQLVSLIGESLVRAGAVDVVVKEGLLRDKTSYLPKEGVVDRIVEKIRAEILEDGLISDDIIYLIGLMDAGGLIENYFSKYERKRLKARLQELRDNEAYQMTKEVMEMMAALIIVITVAS